MILKELKVETKLFLSHFCKEREREREKKNTKYIKIFFSGWVVGR